MTKTNLGMRAALGAIRTFIRDQYGTNGIEYSLLAGLIAVVFATASSTVGASIDTFLANVSQCVNTLKSAACLTPTGSGSGSGNGSSVGTGTGSGNGSGTGTGTGTGSGNGQGNGLGHGNGKGGHGAKGNRA